MVGKYAEKQFLIWKIWWKSFIEQKWFWMQSKVEGILFFPYWLECFAWKSLLKGILEKCWNLIRQMIVFTQKWDFYWMARICKKICSKIVEINMTNGRFYSIFGFSWMAYICTIMIRIFYRTTHALIAIILGLL